VDSYALSSLSSASSRPSPASFSTPFFAMLAKGSDQIRLLSLSASLASFGALVAADINKNLKNDVTLVATAILGMIWAGPLSTLAGASRYPDFRLWMPFFGGPKFIILQSLGWFLYSSCLTCSMVVLFNINAAKKMDGTLTSLGLLGTASTLLLNTSISFFDGSSKANNNKGPHSIVGLRIIWNAHSVVSLLVTTGGLICFMASDIIRSQWIAVPLLRVGATAFVLSSIITHYFNGPSELEHYRFFQPFQGGYSFVTLQGFGWMFLGVVLQCVMALPSDLSVLVFDGLLSMVGVVGFFSQLTLIASLSHFQSKNFLIRMSQEPGKAVQVSAQMIFCLMLMIWPAVLLAGVYLLSKTYPALKNSIDVSTVVFAAMPMLFSSGPLSHIAGKTMHKNYYLWQPFEGGMVHVVSQAFGWMLYSVSLTLGTVYLFNHHRDIDIRDVLRLLPVTFLSQLVIWVSIFYFDPSHDNARKKETEASTFRASNERLAACILSICSLVLCAFIDHTEMDEFRKIYVRPVIICSTFLGLLSCAVGQLAGVRRFQTFRIWQPFKGGKKFVLMQVCAWTSVGFYTLVCGVVGSSRTPALEFRGLMSFLGVWGLVNNAVLIYSQSFYEEVTQKEEVAVSVSIPASRSPELFAALHHLKAFTRDKPRDDSNRLAFELIDGLVRELVAISKDPSAQRNQKGLRAEESLNVLFSAVSISMFVLSDVFRGGAWASCAEIPFVLACASGVCSIAWSHLVCGPNRHPDNYLGFMPFQGGFRFVTLQALGWSLFGLSIVSLSTCFFVGVSAIPLKGVITAIGLNFFVGQLLLFLSTFLFDPNWRKSNSPTWRLEKEFTWTTPCEAFCSVPDANVSSDSKESEFETSMKPLHQTQGVSRELSGNNGPRSSVCGGLFSILIGLGSLGCFAGADIATVFFGAEFPVLPARICAVIAVLTSVPLTWWLTISNIRRREDRPSSRHKLMPKGGFMTMQLLGWALWSFTVLVGILFCYDVIHTSNVIRWGRGSLGGTVTGISGITAQLLVLFSLEGSHRDTWGSHHPDSPKSRSLLDEVTALLESGRWSLRGTQRHYSMLSITKQIAYAVSIITVHVLYEKVYSEGHDLSWHTFRQYCRFISPISLLGVTTTVLAPVLVQLCWFSVDKMLKKSLAWTFQWVVAAVDCFAVKVSIPMIRLFLDWPMYYYAYAWRPTAFAQDGKGVLEDLKMERRVRYGKRREEVLDVIWPMGRTLEGRKKQHRGAILYAHGGGWISCNSEILLHSITPLARAGFVVYSIDYPLAPESTYPEPVFSVLKALSWMKVRDGCSEVFLLGDSAGGNLVTMAAALLENRALLDKVVEQVASPITLLSFPKILRVCSIYGVLDQASWKNTLGAPAVDFCLRKFKPRSRAKSERKGEDILQQVTIMDIPEALFKSYPDTLLICGLSDPLIESSRAAFKFLKCKGCNVALKEYPGVHGFLGFPAQWTRGAFAENAVPATEDMCTFFTHGVEAIDDELKRIRLPRDKLPFDWSPFFVAFLLLISGCAFIMTLYSTVVAIIGHSLLSRSFLVLCSLFVPVLRP